MSAPAEKLARRFHDLYEQLAPGFGYETREETRCFIAESPNGKLMIAVCEAIAQSPEVQALIRAAVLDGQLRVMERGRIDTPDELRAIRTPDAPASADALKFGSFLAK